MKTKNEIKKILVELLDDKGDFAFLFGSWARGEAYVNSTSDVDCAVFFQPHIVAAKSYFDLAEQFEELVGCKLDIICLNTADIIIASQVVATGEVLFSHSKNQLYQYQAYVMGRYLDFKQSRKIIEDNVENDVVLAKIDIIKKCVATIETIQGSEIESWMVEDLSILNLQRAIQASIDLAHVVIAKYGFGLPSDYGQSFDILAKHKVIKREVATVLKKMVGFRNVSVHEYKQVNGDIVKSIISYHLNDFEVYYTQVHGFVFGVK